MKTQSPPRMLLLLLASVFGILVLSHADARPKYRTKLFYNPVYLERDSHIVYAPSAIKISRLNNISLGAKRDFIARFKEVNNATWHVIENGFVAKFTSADESTSVTYKESGEWLYTIKNYGEKAMQQAVRAIVKRTYYDYDIVNIAEIQVPRKDSPVFLVYVQDKRSIKVLRICDGEMEIIHDYLRG